MCDNKVYVLKEQGREEQDVKSCVLRWWPLKKKSFTIRKDEYESVCVAQERSRSLLLGQWHIPV